MSEKQISVTEKVIYVLKRLKKSGTVNVNELYVNHQIATVSRNSAQPMYAPEVPRELIEKYNDLPSNYYTVDYAELEDNTWKVIEAGDGSVSGLSEGQSPEHYYRALYHCMN